METNDKNFEAGYLQNISNTGYYAAKRSILPGEKVPFKQLYAALKGEVLGYKQDDTFVEYIKGKFKNNSIWKVVYGATEPASAPKQHKLRATGGVIETSSDNSTPPSKKSMSRVTGDASVQNPPEITIEMLLEAGSFEKIEELVTYVKSPQQKKRLLSRASEVARTRGGKEGHYRAIEKLREKLFIK